MLPLHDICRYVMEISMKTGSYIKEKQKHLQASDIVQKAQFDWVTNVDKRAEEILVDALQIIVPEAGFITEENTIARENKEYMWVIDPIDGTSNYAHKLPWYCISIALQRHKETVLGVVYDPNQQECFYAVKGQGAFLNGQPISTSTISDLQNAMLATGFPNDKYGQIDAYLQCMKSLLLECRTIRRMGSAALDICYVACGRFEGFYEYGLKLWDIAAAQLIAQEAGAIISNYGGTQPFVFDKEIIVSNSLIYNSFQQKIYTHYRL